MKYSVVCLKYGDKYSSDYVNKLFNMVSRNLSLDFEFYCMTDNTENLNEKIKILPLKLDSEINTGWWYKISLFNPELPIEGLVLFLDLDIIICGSLDKFFTYETDSFCIIEKFMKHNKAGVNSSCFRFEVGKYTMLFNQFNTEKKKIMEKYDGDQDLIGFEIPNRKYWPRSWVSSFKLNMIDKSKIKKMETIFVIDEEPKYTEETALAVFHGEPNPHQIKNSWVEENWR